MLQRVAIVIRHGERNDDVNGSTIPEGDPPLSAQGISNITPLAEEMKKHLPANFNVAAMKMICSPFQRCRQTADGLRQAGIGNADIVTIDDDVCEVFGPIRIKTPEAPQPWQPGSVGKRPVWGEDIDEALTRMRAAFAKYVASMEQSFIIVTHGDMVDALFRSLFPKRMLYSAEYLAHMILELPSLKDIEFSETPDLVDPRILHVHGLSWLDEEDGGGGDGLEPRPEPITLAAPTKPRKHKKSEPATVKIQTVHAVGGASAHKVEAEHCTVSMRSPAGASSSTTPYGEMERSSPTVGGGGGSHQRHRPNHPETWEMILLRVAAVSSQFAMLASDAHTVDVIGFTAAVAAVDVVAAVRPIYWHCPDRPLATRFNEHPSDDDGEGGGSSPLILGQRRPVQPFRVPGVSGVVKYAIAVVAFVLLSVLVDGVTNRAVGGIGGRLKSAFGTPVGIGCICFYLLCDVVRAWPRDRRFST